MNRQYKYLQFTCCSLNKSLVHNTIRLLVNVEVKACSVNGQIPFSVDDSLAVKRTAALWNSFQVRHRGTRSSVILKHAMWLYWAIHNTNAWLQSNLCKACLLMDVADVWLKLNRYHPIILWLSLLFRLNITFVSTLFIVWMWRNESIPMNFHRTLTFHEIVSKSSFIWTKEQWS